MPPPLTEKAWQGMVIEAARLLGWLVYHTHDSRRSAPGFPDLVLVRDTVVFVELKTDVGKLSPAQVDWHERLRAAGAIVRTWRPHDWPSVQLALR